MSSPHAPLGHPPPRSLRVLSCRGLGCRFRHHLRSLQISSWDLDIGGYGGQGGLCWSLQGGPRVTAAPQGRWRTRAPSSGRKGLRVLASVSHVPSLCREVSG